MYKITEEDKLRHEHYDLIPFQNEYIIEYDKTGTIIYISSEVKSVLGYEPSELVNKNGYQTICKKDQGFVIKLQEDNNKKLSHDNAANRVRYRRISKDGNEIYVQGKAKFINNEISVCVETCITDLQILEHISKQAKNLEDKMYDCIIDCTEKGKIRFANQRFYDLSQFEKENEHVLNIYNFIDKIYLKTGSYPNCYLKTLNGQQIKVDCCVIYDKTTDLYSIILKKNTIDKEILFRSFIHELRNPMNCFTNGYQVLCSELNKIEVVVNTLTKKTKWEYQMCNKLHNIINPVNISLNASMQMIRKLLDDFLEFETIQSHTFTVKCNDTFSIVEAYLTDTSI